MNRLNNALTLEGIIRSDTRREVLWVFYSDPNQAYGLREIARLISKHPNAVLREVKFLKQAGLLLVDQRPTKHIYRLNREHSFYSDLMGLFHKSYGLGGMLLHNIRLLDQIELMLLTSFYLLKEPKGKYDVDLFIVGKPNLERLTTLINNIEVKLEYPITYTVLDHSEFVKRRESRDPFVWGILKRPFVILIGNHEKIFGE